MQIFPQRRGTLWSLVIVLAAAPLPRLHGQEKSEAAAKFGREAREGTPILNRDPDKPLSERERIHHVLSRFTFGATPESIAEVEKIGLEKWFRSQLEGDVPKSRKLIAKLAKLESLEMTNQQILSTYRLKVASLSKKLTPKELQERAKRSRMRYVPRKQLKDAVLLRAVLSPHQVLEVTSDFWRNHFNVDVTKGNVGYYATTYERDVIRAEALGTFRNMLNKQARHPAMLVYLDNFISRATPPRELLEAGRKALLQSRDYVFAQQAIDIAKMRGLNENYARELMELHTLGVDNYYTQEDVIAVAEALTGWTVNQNPEKPVEFQFRADMHATAPRRILKVHIAANPHNPEAEGQAVLDLLARHKGTAEFIAYKLCRYFVDDTPPGDMVHRVASTFRRRKTDLKATYLAIFNDKEFFNPKYYQSKFKTPLEFVASALRVTNAEFVDDPRATDYVHRALLSMCEPIYQCEDPTGYYDQADAWRDPGVMAVRWQFGLGIGMEWMKGVRIPPSYWEDLEPNNPLQWKEVLTKRILPLGCTDRTSEALDDVIARYAKYNPKPEQLGRYIVGILLGSPEFQRQ